MGNSRVCRWWLPANALVSIGLAFCGAYSASVVAEQADDHNEESAVVTETKDFLSDRSRVGSVVGTLLAGASFAHPFAPIGGSIIGFFVGKSTDYTDDDEETAEERFARRSFAPGEGSVSDSGGQLAFSSPGDGASLSFSPDGSEDGTGRRTSSVDGNTVKPSSSPRANLIISKDVGGHQAELDRLAAIIRGERNGTPFQLNLQCPNQEASRIRKKVVVAGFNVENPDQAVFGGLGSVGRAANEWLYQNLQATGEVLPLSAPGRQMFASLKAGPTLEIAGNRLEQYSAVSRQMGAQFVVSGIIRNLNVNRAESWDSSYASSIKRSLFSADTVREFVVDVVLHDGYTGQVVSEQRYTASGRWDIPRTGKVSFGSPVFNESEYGIAVAEVFDGITDDLMSTIDCQALLVPILEVSGKELLLDIGTRSGLLPGDKLRVVRAESSLQRPNAPPKLWDTGVDLHLHQLSLDTSRAWMPEEGAIINVRKGDYAVMY
jgi:hypothetical protein